jgi:hypothetical protein
MRAAHKRGMQYAGTGDVVDEPRTADKQRVILQARDARSDRLTHGLLAQDWRDHS